MNRGIKLLSSLFLTLAFTAAVAQMPPAATSADSAGALAAIRAIPKRYQDGVLKISADNAKVNPRKWYIVAHDNDDTPKNFVVSDGQLVSDSSGLAQNLRSIFTGGKPINLAKVNVDSNGAWRAAQTYASSKGSKLGTVSYALQQKGRSSAPIWSIWCYTQDDSYIGMVQILATSGEVVTSE